MNKSNSRSELPEKEPNMYGRTKEIEVIVQAHGVEKIKTELSGTW